MVLCQRCYLQSRYTKTCARIGTSQIAGTLSATNVLPFQCPCTNHFFLSQEERGRRLSSSSSPVGTVGNRLLRVWKRGQVRDSKSVQYGNGFEVFHSFHRRLCNMLRHDSPNKTRQFSCRSYFCYVSVGMGRDSVEFPLYSCVAAVCVFNNLSSVSFLLFL